MFRTNNYRVWVLEVQHFSILRHTKNLTCEPLLLLSYTNPRPCHTAQIMICPPRFTLGYQSVQNIFALRPTGVKHNLFCYMVKFPLLGICTWATIPPHLPDCWTDTVYVHQIPARPFPQTVTLFHLWTRFVFLNLPYIIHFFSQFYYPHSSLNKTLKKQVYENNFQKIVFFSESVKIDIVITNP